MNFREFALHVLLSLMLMVAPQLYAKVLVGSDRLKSEGVAEKLQGKTIGLITNHTAINSAFVSTIDTLRSLSKPLHFHLIALFAPEHGIHGASLANQTIETTKTYDNLPIYSLYGETRRPTDEMLKGIDLLIYDIQDIGARSYTYITTMFYAMEEAAKRGIEFIVLDRPNPINGIIVDGPMLEEKFRSMVGYINVPYCHGMTVGELANYFNAEYKVGCKLTIIPMKGWKRSMSFQETGLPWIPTSPYIPEPTTPYFYATTGILGELKMVSIGIGYTLPFKLVGAPWIDGEKLVKELNAQKFPGVYFTSLYFCPTFGRFAKQACQGALIMVTDHKKFKPVSTQYMILGVLKNLYPKQYLAAQINMKEQKTMLCKLNGTEEIYRILTEEKSIIWKLCQVHEKEKNAFIQKRKKYLVADYDG